MRLLIVNFEMDLDSGVLAWQASVARELARSCEFVVVLTGRLGRFDPPPNMHVETIQPRPFGVPRRLGGLWMVNWQVFQLCQRYRIDGCFIHMAMEWAYRLYPCLRVLHVPVMMWYAHGTVTKRLRMAHRCVQRVVTSTPDGFRIPSSRVRVIGQGIDTDLFRPMEPSGSRDNLITISRVSRRKRIELLLDVMGHLRQTAGGSAVRLRIVGPLLTADDLRYDMDLRTLVWRKGLNDAVEFAGFVPQEYIPSIYRSTFLHINVSHTGSMDKTIMEALACGCPVLTSNPAVFDTLKDYPEFIIRDERPQAIAGQVLSLYEQRANCDRDALRSLVVGHHDVRSYAEKLLGNLREIRLR